MKEFRPYEPKEKVEGEVKVSVGPGGLPAKAIVARLDGRARVEFRGGGGDLRKSEEYYCNETSVLYQNASVSSIPVGNYSYPFAFTLPAKIPSSFEGELGWVRYRLEVRIVDGDDDASAANRCHDDSPPLAQSFLTVLNPLDLNTLPAAKQMQKSRAQKHFCSLCCRNGPLSVVATLAKSGFAARERIRLVAKIDNRSRVDVGRVYVKLVKLTSFYADGEVRIGDSTVTGAAGEVNVGPGDCSVWRNEEMVVPFGAPTSYLRYCNSIDVEYWIEIKVGPSGPHSSLELNVPVIIGTVPIPNMARRRVDAVKPAAATAAAKKLKENAMKALAARSVGTSERASTSLMSPN